MSGAIDGLVKVATLGLASNTKDLVKIGTLGAIDMEVPGVDTTSTTDVLDDADEQAQTDATNAARVASKKKKAVTSSVLTSPLGATTTAATAVTKLGGM